MGKRIKNVFPTVNGLRFNLIIVILYIVVVIVGVVDSIKNDDNSGETLQLKNEFSHLQQKRQLSPSEQAQILSDVRQHETRFSRVNQPQQLALENTTPYPNLSKYKVDRAKQQQQQQLLQQRALILRQQQLRENQQLGQNFFEPSQSQYQPQSIKQQPQYQGILSSQQEQYNQYQRLPSNNKYQNLNGQSFDDAQTIQLQNYYEKQRQLEILQRQRERLLAEQQELRRQQEFLRLQQLRQLTTTTSTQSPTPLQTTFSPLLLSSPSARKITPSESELFIKAIANHQKKFSTVSTTTSLPAVSTTVAAATTTSTIDNKQDIPKDILSLIEAQESQNNPSLSRNGKSRPQIQVIYQTEKPPAGETSRQQKSSSKTKSSQSSNQREALLKQLKLALLQSGSEDGAKNLATRDLILPNGKTVQVIRAPPNSLPNDGSPITSESLQEIVKESLPTTSIKPPKAILEELTKGVVPPGAEFEVLRHKVDGNLEAVGKSPLENSPAKKVTFVVLEEQPDGSYKVQGVRGNAGKENGGDVESIVERIKNGELKLPPPSTKSLTTTPNVVETESVTENPSPSTKSFVSLSPTTLSPRATARNIDFSKSSNDYFPFVTVSSAGEPGTDRYVSSATTPTSHVYNSFGTTSRSSIASKYNPSSVTRNSFIPTMAPVNEIVTQYQTTTTPNSLPTTNYPDYTTTVIFNPTTYSHFGSRTLATTTPRAIESTTILKEDIIREENYGRSSTAFTSTPFIAVTPPAPSSDSNGDRNLIKIFKRQGLYAMAKFLGQSGLDTILNDTGPYTIFAPTDKAFRNLLVQLGGPEKAEQKFRESPRLLSGLLLHHVIPGAFRVDSLQDEMTGVSLAGTQLRVNTYSMQDVEWNDVRVTTINGARVLPDKQDIEIPQGIAHAVDRVMFPLPVGDLVQTLQADRERRFTVFLRALHASGLEETLTGTKTFTIFAPTDTAFMIASASPNGSPPWLDDEDNKEAAKALVSRHVIPSTLFSAGMRYYQQKETLNPQASLHIHKNSGRIKVNNAQVISHNIPATNGVIHAVDTLL